MAFAQITHRESLRDIEICLWAQNKELYHMGIRGRVSKSSLADANEKRDWRNSGWEDIFASNRWKKCETLTGQHPF